MTNVKKKKDGVYLITRKNVTKKHDEKHDERVYHLIILCIYPMYIYIYIYIYICICLMYSYILMVPMNQRVLNKLNKEHNINGHKWSTTHRVLKSHRSKMIKIYMLSWKYISYYAHLSSVRFEHSMCRGSLITTYIMLLI